jgi:hypothetical protein
VEVEVVLQVEGVLQEEVEVVRQEEEQEPQAHPDPHCYGRLAVVSDVDDGGFALNVDKELRGSAVLYRSKYNGAMLRSRWT